MKNRLEDASDLHGAVLARDLDEIEAILKRGISLDSRTHVSETPLMVAARLGYDELLAPLVNGGIRINAKSKRSSTDDGTKTALHFAAESDHLSSCQVLLKLGADPNVPSQWGFTPLCYAVQRENEILVQFLLENGANPNGSDSCGMTPLMIGLARGNSAIVEKLLHANADVNRRSSDGNFPLLMAHKAELALQLLRRGADVNMRNSVGKTALMELMPLGNVDLLKCHILAGAEVNAKDNEGHTPLMLLTHEPRIEIADLLLERGANVNAFWRPNLTVLDYIVSDRGGLKTQKLLRSKLVEHLKSKGAKLAAER